MNGIKKDVLYCLNCFTKPCVKGCPLGNDISKFIKLAEEGKFLEAYNVLNQTTVLSSICGRICPVNRLCEGNCVRKLKGNAVQIGKIEAFISDRAIKKKYPLFDKVLEDNGKKVAVVGAGPAGLTCAAFLRKMGYLVTIYEKHDYLGGIISHGIPDFRIEKNVCESSFKRIIDLGIEVKYNFELGKNIMLKDLRKDYDAVFLSFGANVNKFPNVKGKNLENVYGANEFLESRRNISFKGKSSVVVGGGDVAMDMARVIRKSGGNVLVVYRGDEKDMKADNNILSKAKEEKIDFIFNTNLKQILSGDKGYRVYLASNNGFRYVCLSDYVFFAIGSKPYDKLVNSLGIKLDIDGYIKTDKNYMTSLKGVFAGGDLINAPKTVAYAARTGRDAAYNIDSYLKNVSSKK